MKTRLCSLVALALFALTTTTGTAQAAEARPPVGIWKDASGKFVLFLGANGTASYSYAGRVRCAGVWTWDFRTSVGGIATIHYRHAGFVNKLYFGITYINANTIVCNPGARVVLRRVG
jgi:hypothetical protein